MVDKKTVMKELKKVLDPEIGIPITEMRLIDDVKIDKGTVIVEFHLSMPHCPQMFATEIARSIRSVVSEIKGVKLAKINLKDHYMADQINKEINK